jgi:hypothetical protein
LPGAVVDIREVHETATSKAALKYTRVKRPFHPEGLFNPKIL